MAHIASTPRYMHHYTTQHTQSCDVPTLMAQCASNKGSIPVIPKVYTLHAVICGVIGGWGLFRQINIVLLVPAGLVHGQTCLN